MGLLPEGGQPLGDNTVFVWMVTQLYRDLIIFLSPYSYAYDSQTVTLSEREAGSSWNLDT